MVLQCCAIHDMFRGQHVFVALLLVLYLVHWFPSQTQPCKLLSTSGTGSYLFQNFHSVTQMLPPRDVRAGDIQGYVCVCTHAHIYVMLCLYIHVCVGMCSTWLACRPGNPKGIVGSIAFPLQCPCSALTAWTKRFPWEQPFVSTVFCLTFSTHASARPFQTMATSSPKQGASKMCNTLKSNFGQSARFSGSCLMVQIHHSLAMSYTEFRHVNKRLILRSNMDICHIRHIRHIRRICRICRVDAWLRSLRWAFQTALSDAQQIPKQGESKEFTCAVYARRVLRLCLDAGLHGNMNKYQQSI